MLCPCLLCGLWGERCACFLSTEANISLDWSLMGCRKLTTQKLVTASLSCSVQRLH